jgi:hypothetical protein
VPAVDIEFTIRLLGRRGSDAAGVGKRYNFATQGDELFSSHGPLRLIHLVSDPVEILERGSLVREPAYWVRVV